MAEPNLDAERRQPLAERVLDRGLVDEQAHREAGRRRLHGSTSKEQAPGTVHEVEPVERPAVDGDAGLGEDAERVAVEVRRARDRVRRRRPLQHEHADAALAEQRRQRAADRTEADDGHVEAGGGVRHRPRNTAARARIQRAPSPLPFQ